MLSIVAPVYNAEMYLRECVESVIHQSYTDFELLLIDDGSTDNSLAICKEYEQIDNRIIVLSGKHMGPYFARKTGVIIAQGDYITFIDADDFISEEAYLLAERDMGKQIDVISFDIIRYFNNDNIRCDKCALPEKVYNRQEIIEEIFPVMIWDDSRNTYGLDPSLCSKLFKSGLLKEYYSMTQDIRFHYGEDVAVVYPVIREASSLSVHHEAYYYHRQRNKNVVPSYIEDKQYLDKLYDLYRFLLDSMADYPIFQKQIDLFYVYSVQLTKRKYGTVTYPQNSIFPFDEVEKNEKVIIYGAGNVGKLYVHQLNMLNYCRIVLWVDKNHEQFDDKVHSPEEILNNDYDRIIIAIADSNVKRQAREYLIELGINEAAII